MEKDNEGLYAVLVAAAAFDEQMEQNSFADV